MSLMVLPMFLPIVTLMANGKKISLPILSGGREVQPAKNYWKLYLTQILLSKFEA